MRVLLAAGAIAVLVVSPVTSVAHADGAGVIAIVDRAGAVQGSSAAVARALTVAIGGRAERVIGDAVGAARAARAAGAIPIEALARFERVREQVEDGWRAYLRVAGDVAALKLAAARADAEALVTLSGGAEVYADAALRLGAVLGNLGRDDEANAALTLALALDPERPITLAEFSPDVIDRVATVRAARPPLVKLAVTAGERGMAVTGPVEVAVDGTVVGIAPLTIDVPRGQHLVAGTAAGMVPAVTAVNAVAATTVVLELEPDREATILAAGGVAGMPAADAAALADATLRYADLDEVVLAMVTTRRGGPTLLAQRCAGVPARCSAVVEISYAEAAGLPAAARDAWAAMRTGELRYAPSVFTERGEHDSRGADHRCRACRSPWVWGGIGAAVVLGAVVTAIAVSGAESRPTIVVPGSVFTGQPDP